MYRDIMDTLDIHNRWQARREKRGVIANGLNSMFVNVISRARKKALSRGISFDMTRFVTSGLWRSAEDAATVRARWEQRKMERATGAASAPSRRGGRL